MSVTISQRRVDEAKRNPPNRDLSLNIESCDNVNTTAYETGSGERFIVLSKPAVKSRQTACSSR